MPQTLIDLDIREGDTLTVDGKNYPVKAVQTFTTGGFHGSTFRRMAVKQASVTRQVADGAGGYTPTILYEGIACTPLDPQTFENTRREALRTPEQLLQTYIASTNGFYKLLLEDLKK